MYNIEEKNETISTMCGRLWDFGCDRPPDTSLAIQPISVINIYTENRWRLLLVVCLDADLGWVSRPLAQCGFLIYNFI